MHAENLFAHQVSVHQLKFHEECSVFCCVLAVPSACSGMCAGVEKQQIGHDRVPHAAFVSANQAGRGRFGFAVQKKSLQASSSAGLLT